jgi:hypothetical protein
VASRPLVERPAAGIHLRAAVISDLEATAAAPFSGLCQARVLVGAGYILSSVPRAHTNTHTDNVVT